MGAVEQDRLLSDGDEKSSMGISSHMMAVEGVHHGMEVNYITKTTTKIKRSSPGHDHDHTPQFAAHDRRYQDQSTGRDARTLWRRAMPLVAKQRFATGGGGTCGRQ